MSYSHKFGINPSTACVEVILFSLEHEDQGITVSASKGWEVEDKTKRPKDWTREMIDLEYSRCDAMVDFSDLLRKRHAKKVARRPSLGVVHIFQE